MGKKRPASPIQQLHSKVTKACALKKNITVNVVRDVVSALQQALAEESKDGSSADSFQFGPMGLGLLSGIRRRRKAAS